MSRVRILAESLLWEDRRGKKRIELQKASLHAWSRTEGVQLRAACGFFTKAMVQELITVIQEETKCTEETEELRGWVQITNVVNTTSTGIDQQSQET